MVFFVGEWDIFQVRLTPSGTNMKILQPHVIAIRRNYLPALKVEYSTSAHQSSFRIQIYRIQVSLEGYSNHILKKYGNRINIFPWSVLSVLQFVGLECLMPSTS